MQTYAQNDGIWTQNDVAVSVKHQYNLNMEIKYTPTYESLLKSSILGVPDMRLVFEFWICS